ncbi:MAG: F0F1 ATP synthase subunit A [Planctomycetota bacterium]|jgi:F-type H+-transporting ATPase subunit a
MPVNISLAGLDGLGRLVDMLPAPTCSGGGGGADVLHHIMDSEMFHIAGPLYFTKHALMMGLVFLFCCLCFLPLAVILGKTRGHGPKGWFTNLFESFIVFMRDEVIGPNLGPQKDRFLPFFLTLFHFILFCNLLGMIPGAATATGNLGVTAGLALITLFLGIVGGLIIQGPIPYVKNIVPHGIPWPILFILYPIEVAGLLIKHVALAMRLFANMIAGHIVLGSLIMLIFMAKSYLVAPGPILMAVALSGLEIFVAFLQAYVFVLLGSMFVGMAVHPEH